MATVYRQKNRPNWMIAWHGGDGVRRVRSSGTTDKRAAERLAAKLTADSMLAREGIVDPRAGQFAAAGRRPIDAHIEDFIQYLRDKNSTDQHAADRESQIKRLITVMGADRLADLSPARVQRAIAKIREERKVSLRTLNRYQVAIKSLSRWLVREGRIESDPLQGLTGFNAETDRRHRRRALTADEVRLLVAAAENGPRFQGVDGPDRATLYRVAAGTGFRASEIASLTPDSFDLDGAPPTITVRAGYSKNRHETVHPIRRDLAKSLRPWVASKQTGAPVFDVPGLRYRTARMMRFDLEAAELSYVDDDGQYADFHALRHSYITDVVRAGASVKEAQTLARHATPDLTFRVYAHARLHDLTRTLDAMPATATGTETTPVPATITEKAS